MQERQTVRHRYQTHCCPVDHQQMTMMTEKELLDQAEFMLNICLHPHYEEAQFAQSKARFDLAFLATSRLCHK